MRTRAVAALIALAASAGAFAQAYPNKPIRMLAISAPGGGTDLLARTYAQGMADSLGQSIVIDNKPGGGGIIATETLAKAPPDGYTILMTNTSHSVLPSLHKKLPYDVNKDFAPVSLVALTHSLLLVNPSLPVKSIKDFIAYARDQQGKLSVASPGVGSANHLAMELLTMHTQFKYLHVPYKGAGEAVVALASGQTMASLPSVAGMLPLVESGKVRALAVTTLKRVASLPNTPTVDETIVPGFNYGVWYGVAVPAATPRVIVDRLNAALTKAVQVPDVREAMDKQAMVPLTGTPSDFAGVIAREIDQTAKLMQAAGLKPE